MKNIFNMYDETNDPTLIWWPLIIIEIIPLFSIFQVEYWKFQKIITKKLYQWAIANVLCMYIYWILSNCMF